MTLPFIILAHLSRATRRSHFLLQRLPRELHRVIHTLHLRRLLLRPHTLLLPLLHSTIFRTETYRRLK